MLDSDQRALQLESWLTILKSQETDGWTPTLANTTEAKEAEGRERQRLRQAESSKRHEEVKRRTEMEFKRRATTMKAAAEIKKRTRPVGHNSALYSSASESENSDNKNGNNDSDSVDSETRRASAIRERQKQRRRR
jgi:hypothetical protein